MNLWKDREGGGGRGVVVAFGDRGGVRGGRGKEGGGGDGWTFRESDGWMSLSVLSLSDDTLENPYFVSIPLTYPPSDQ